MTGGHFLVVEDDATFARVIQRFIAAGAFGEATIASTACEAGSLLSVESRWNGMIVDVRLPDGSGLEILEAARAGAHAFTPAIVITGALERSTVNRAYDLHARILAKPFGMRRHLGEWLGAVTSASRIGLVLKAWRLRYGLSVAECDILRFAIDGRSRKEIASARKASESTVKNQIGSLLARMDCQSLREVIVRLLREAAIA